LSYHAAGPLHLIYSIFVLDLKLIKWDEVEDVEPDHDEQPKVATAHA
jgi:hypothetical protein